MEKATLKEKIHLISTELKQELAAAENNLNYYEKKKESKLYDYYLGGCRGLEIAIDSINEIEQIIENDEEL